MDKTKGKRVGTSESSLNIQAKADIKADGSGRIWVRDDGAICIDNECVVIESAKDGAVDFTVDPNKCSCEAGSAIYESILKSALTGKGSRITIKPKEE
jgi:hypothetical protein